MMRSLWAGVTGLQAHQIAMDVESNNIANVNTVGFKYSRANFSDLMNQTAKVATAPQGELGGKNPMQIGLGTQINSITKIFKQGSVQTTDKNTDLAIQGDGFFVVSPDGGKTYKYTRSGDFVRDALGNFVDNNGYIAQGWLRDEVTGEVDTTAPIKNIIIKPGLTTPANPTSNISLKANLNSGNSIGDKKTPIYQLDTNHNWTDVNGNGIISDSGVHKENDVSLNRFVTTKDGQLRLNERGVDMGVLFNVAGESLGLRKGQGMWVSYAEARTQALELNDIDNNGRFNAPKNLNIEINGTKIASSVSSIADIAAAINGAEKKTGVRADIINGNQLVLINDNKTGTTAATKNIIVKMGDGVTPDDTGIITRNAMEYDIDKNTYEKNAAAQFDALIGGNNGATPPVPNAGNKGIPAKPPFNNYTLDFTGFNAGQTWANLNAQQREDFLNQNNFFKKIDPYTSPIKVVTAYQYTYDPNPVNTEHGLNHNVTRGFNTTEDLREAMQKDARLYVNYDGRQVNDDMWATNGTKNDGVEVRVDEKGQFVIKNPKGDAFNADDGDIVDTTTEGIKLRAGNFFNELMKALQPNQATLPATAAGNVVLGNTTYNGHPDAVANGINFAGLNAIPGGKADWNSVVWNDLSEDAKRIFIENNEFIKKSWNKNTNDDSFNMFLSVSNLSNPANNVNENEKFMKTMQGLQGALTTGDGVRQTQGLYMSAHSSSIDIFDSLGTKHSIKYDFTKVGYTDDGGTEWGIVIQVPEPCEINISGEGPKNVLTGTIRFNSDGSLQGFSPSSVSFTANNGSTPNQNIDFFFGNPNDFDGITSYDRESNTSGISQDGFSGGDLNGIRVDESGTIIGSFTNGRSFGLAQIAMATFTNNEGLEAEGGNVFTQTSNSGEPVIGAATTGGRGKVQASSLEMSNVDLSRSLTELIVIQRGYQANSKTITTSDQMLNTLLQLKQ